MGFPPTPPSHPNTPLQPGLQGSLRHTDPQWSASCIPTQLLSCFYVTSTCRVKEKLQMPPSAISILIY